MKISNFKFHPIGKFGTGVSKWPGQTLIELVLVMGIAAIILPALLTGLVASRNGKPQQEKRMQAISVLKESEAALRNIRNSNWGQLSQNGTYHTEISGSVWTLAQDSFTNSDGIKQEVIISDVVRDSDGAIATSSGAVDPSTKKVDIIISWTMPSVSSINSTMFFTRTKNVTFAQTTQADFNAGTATDTSVIATGGSATDGEVALTTVAGGGSGGSGGSSSDWCAPNLSITALDLPKNGVANAISAIEGRVFAGTGNNSSGESFVNISVSDTDPPNASVLRSFNGYKTNDVFGEANYGYIATDTNSKEIVIVNLTTNPYSEAGNFNSSGNTDANSVYVSGNTGYMTAGSTFYTFDLSSKSGSRAQLDSINLPGTGNSIAIRGNYAYVALGSSGAELQIIDVTNPGSITLLGTGEVDPQNLNSGDIARDVYVNQAATRAYIVIDAATSIREFYIFDISTKTGSRSIIGSYEANGTNPKGVTVIAEHNKAILVGTGGEEYQVIDISSESAPVRCGGLNINTGVNGVSSVSEADGDAYSYIITGDSSAELKIIEGGPGEILQSNWCSPQDSIVRSVTLPKRGNSLSAQANSAFIGTGNGGAGEDFVKVGVTHYSPPTLPNASITATHAGTSQTNGVYNDGTYAYLAINGSTEQVRILNTSSTPYTQVGTITVPSGTNANGVYVSGNTAYVTSAGKLYAFNVTAKTGAHTSVLSQVDLHVGSGGTPIARHITVVGSKAYVSASDTEYGLQVFTTGTNGSSLKLVGVSDLTWEQTAQGIAVNSTGTRGYVPFSNGTGSVSKGFYIVDISPVDPPDWWVLPNFYTIIGTYNSGDTSPTGLAIASGSNNRVIMTGTGGTNQYHAVDISIEADPIFCGGLSIASGVNGIASIQDASSRGYSYIVTGEATNDFKIIQGGSGGGNYIEDGIFESSIFEASTSASFNRFIANVTKPAQTTLRMQVAAAPQISGSCNLATYNYVGPDGSSTSFFNPNGGTIAAAIPFGSYSPSYENPAQCFRYKTWFTTWDTGQTPIFNDVTVNYSP